MTSANRTGSVSGSGSGSGSGNGGSNGNNGSGGLGVRLGGLDTLFGRTAVFTILVLLAVQLSWYALLTIQRPRHDADGYARGLLLVIQAAHGQMPGASPLVNPLANQAGSQPRGEQADDEPRVRIVDDAQRPRGEGWDQIPQGPMVHLVGSLRRFLPAGAELHVVGPVERPRTHYFLWIRYPGEPQQQRWIVLPLNPPPPSPILIETVGMLVGAVLLAIGAAWQMQRPLAAVAQLAQRFGRGERPPPVAEKGPREMRDLIHAVNQMVRQISENEDEKALMLAGIAHDLKAPLTRMKLRASVLTDDEACAQFTRDTDSLTRIVQQFLEFAGAEPDDGADVSVDAFLRAQFPASEPGDEGLFVQQLHAGPAFTMPRTLIDRLASNLVDNALDHGAPPVILASRREGAHWVFEVRDHGPGIPESRMEEAGRPFARLDPARSGDGHCGLGLAIVGRLARKRHGRYEIENAPDGGLIVRVVLPMTPEAASLA